MGKLRTEQPEHQEAIDELLGDTEAAFSGPSFWAPFTERCHAAGIPRLSECQPGPPGHRPAGHRRPQGRSLTAKLLTHLREHLHREIALEDAFGGRG
jgi:hypothetical protein